MNPIRLRGIPEGAAIRLQSVGGSPLRLRAVSSLRGPKGDPGTSVPSVFGRVGAILAQADDYTADQIDNDSSVTGDTVKDALEFLAANGGSVDSVNGQTGVVVLDPDDLDDTSTTNKFTDAGDISKLAGIEALADITDAGNVGSTIHGATGKTTPVDADEAALIDSAASNVLKKVTWANIKATLKAYFDAIYVTGPASVTDGRFALFDGTTGKLIKQHTGAPGTAAVKDTGTSGNTVPLLDGTNTWSGVQAISNDTAFAVHMEVRSADDTAGNGPRASWFRNSPSPAANDDLGIFLFDGNDSAGNRTNYFYLMNRALNVTNGAEQINTRFRGFCSGADTLMMSIGPGVVLAAATGGDKGLGSINATDLYNDNVAVTCMALAKEYRAGGEIDTDKWDALIPDVVIPEQEVSAPAMEDIVLDYHSQKLDNDGDIVLVKKSKSWKRQKTELQLVYDEDGNGIEAFERPVFDKVIQPERRIVRQHVVAHLFKAMCADGFDPREPAQYIAKLKADEALPGMPTRAEWAERGHNSIGQGEMFMRKWLAMEMLALVVMNHEERISKLEGSKKLNS